MSEIVEARSRKEDLWCFIFFDFSGKHADYVRTRVYKLPYSRGDAFLHDVSIAFNMLPKNKQEEIEESILGRHMYA